MYPVHPYDSENVKFIQIRDTKFIFLKLVWFPLRLNSFHESTQFYWENIHVPGNLKQKLFQLCIYSMLPLLSFLINYAN